MRAIVDPETCTGCGLCVDICPEIFEMNNDIAEASTESVPQESIELCQEATESCPVEAIRLEED